MVILAILVVSVLLAAAFAAASTEARVSANQGANVDAFALAESGLELFIAKRDSLGFTAVPPAASESARVTLSGGYADVVLHPGAEGHRVGSLRLRDPGARCEHSGHAERDAPRPSGQSPNTRIWQPRP